MAKNISNLPALEPFLIHQNESTNLDKMWQKWMEDFDIYLMATGVTQENQKRRYYYT